MKNSVYKKIKGPVDQGRWFKPDSKSARRKSFRYEKTLCNRNVRRRVKKENILQYKYLPEGREEQF